MTSVAATPEPSVSVADYNPLSPEVRRDPYPYYAALRRDAPVRQMIPGLPIFTVSRYEDVTRVLHDPERFSSTALQVLAQGGIGFSPNAGALAGHRMLESNMMISVDPPDHARLRRMVNRGFTPRRIADLEPRLRQLAGEILEAAAADGRMDLVQDFSIPFPVTVIAELLGVEAERRADFKRWSDTTVIGLSGLDTGITQDDIRKSADEMADYIETVIEARRRAPREDLISILVAAEEGESLTTGEVLAFVVLLLIAGNETTTNLIGNAMKALLAHPDQMAKVQAEPALIPGMIEETLRYDSPIQGIPRKVMEEAEIAGTTLPKDAFLMVLFASANRDDAQFPDAARFDIHRNPQGHVAFGHGIHFCLGASLARLEARIAYETLFARFAHLALDADEIPMVESTLLRGPRSLPLRVEAA